MATPRRALWVTNAIYERYKAAADAKSADQGGRTVYQGEIAIDAIAALERERARAERPAPSPADAVAQLEEGAPEDETFSYFERGQVNG